MLVIIKRIMPHIAFILSIMFIVFLILDKYNPTMNFINNDGSILLLWILCVVSIGNAIRIIIKDNK